MRWPPAPAGSRGSAPSQLTSGQTPHDAALANVAQVGTESSMVVRAGVRWIQNAQGQPVIDRAYNMVQLLNMYMGRSPISDEDVSVTCTGEAGSDPTAKRLLFSGRPVAWHVLE